MKNADTMVKKILTEVDSNGDGKIQYHGTSIIAPTFCTGASLTTRRV